MELAFKWMFWLSLIGLVYTYLGYPVIISALVWAKKKRLKIVLRGSPDHLPLVSLLIPAYNEEAVIRQKVANSLELDYPRSHLEIVVASDGSTDKTGAMLKAYSKLEIRSIIYRKRRGKSEVINRTVPKLLGDIVIVSDASAMLDPDAIKKLLERLNDPEVGCVSGKYRVINGDDSSRGRGEGLYFKYETFLKSKESDFNSILGAHGSLYAIRKHLFQPLVTGIINDDYIIPMQIVEQGYRSVYADDAISTEIAATTIAGEAMRRRRINIGNVQQLFVLRNLLNPLRGKIAFQFISHKLLRLLSPAFLLALMISAVCIGGPFYSTIFVLQLLFHALGVANWWLEQRLIKVPLLTVPFYFTFGMWTIMTGMYAYLINERSNLWDQVDIYAAP
ncbi:MAG: glycosyltransferase family 2 protein [Candidatus Marinimicrobia bacterium]|nr:glycosyltransferase family 2 protein [Candidatus Neomarinimicrobiota bacterium]